VSTGRLVVAITGASGAIYAQRFLLQAVQHFERIYLMVSDQAIQVMATELGLNVQPDTFKPSDLLVANEALPELSHDRIELLDRKNYFSPPASGSFRHDGMVIVPCSMGTAGRIANGISDDLVTRSADVCLKEKRPLILVPRETPWNLIHLRNLTQLAEAGATILPAAPSFYNRPTSIEDVADTVVARILQQLGIDQKVVPEWQFTEPE
jgi:4-hydroxy-3-polyprenylbenzoate decarboxylase